MRSQAVGWGSRSSAPPRNAPAASLAEGFGLGLGVRLRKRVARLVGRFRFASLRTPRAELN